jgi:hypothetical protein
MGKYTRRRKIRKISSIITAAEAKIQEKTRKKCCNIKFWQLT